MFKRFFPDFYVDSIFHLPFEVFEKKGIRAIFFDIDNTVAPFDEPDAAEDIIEFFDNLRNSGYKICLLSNNSKKRVERFNEKLKTHAIYRAGKPGSKKLLDAISHLGVTKEETVLVGDQVFTDVYCARNAGVLSVLTKPISSRDQLITKVKRGMESYVLKLYKRSNSK